MPAVFEHAQVADLPGDVLDVRRAVLPFDADEHQQAVLDGADGPVGDGDGGGGNALDDRPHHRAIARDAGIAATRARSSPGGLSRVSRRWRGATFASALIIDCFTPGCSRSSSMSSLLARWRCRPRS